LKGYGDLYIYILSGVVKEENCSSLGSDFIGNWVEGDNSFLFFGRPADEMIAVVLQLHPGLELVEHHRFSYEAWQGGKLEPVRIPPFLIVPPWDHATVEEEYIRVVLDPGVVFGNGLHPTTKDCLRALAFSAKRKPFRKVLDLGTGTGILSVAAARLGAEAIVAVDLNPLCARTAKRNVAMNDLNGFIRVVEGDAEDHLQKPVDLLIANIHHAVIKKVLNQGRFNPGERVILSGLMRSQAGEVRAQLSGLGFHIQREWDHEMTWFTILAVKDSRH